MRDSPSNPSAASARSRTRTLLQEFDKLTAIVAVVVLVVLVLGYFGLGSWAPRAEWVDLTKGIIVNLIPVSILFVCSYIVLRRVQAIRDKERDEQLAELVTQGVRSALGPVLEDLGREVVFERFNDVPWREFIRNAQRIDITVHYFDTWINSHADDLREFLRRKGAAIRVVLPDVETAEIFQAISRRFPQTDEATLRSKIRNVSLKLRTLQQEARASAASVKVYRTRSTQWYCAVRFDDVRCVLSIYEQARGVAVESPAVVVDLGKHPRTGQWIEREFTALISGAALEDAPGSSTAT